jgi:hypothetical protein
MASLETFGEWDLKAYLAGDALGQTMCIFEDVTGPHVKDKVRAHFAQDPKKPPEHVIAFRKRVLTELKKQKASRDELQAEKAILEIVPASKVKKTKENAQLKKVEKKLKKLQDAVDAVDQRETRRLELGLAAISLEQDEDEPQLKSVRQELATLDIEDAQFLKEEVPPLLWVLECRY